MAPGKVTCASSADAVRQALAENAERPENKPSRCEDPETGRLQLFSSVDGLKKMIPNVSPDLLVAWFRVPIFQVRLFVDRKNFKDGGLERAYAQETFPLGEDLESAILWWRKRVNSQNQGFAVFDGGFDTTGPVYLTEPPRLLVDAATGEVEGDAEEEIDRKFTLHKKRQEMDQRWEKKGVSEELRAKIEQAELKAAERRRNGEQYMLKGGWIPKGGARVDVDRYNDIQRQVGSDRWEKGS